MNDEYSQLSIHEEAQPPPPNLIAEEGVEVPYDLIKPHTLTELIKAFVLREGTDYGAIEVSLDRKIENVRHQLEKKDLKLVYDLSTETGSIVNVR